MTKSGVEANLKISPYVVENNYNGKEVIYYFSTEKNMNRFKNEDLTFFVSVCTSLTNRFRIRFHLPKMFTDIVLYSRIERRGFHVIIEGIETKCVSDLKLIGAELKKEN